MVKGINGEVLGRLVVVLSELMLSSKQSYYQSLVLGENEVIGNLVVGYAISRDGDNREEVHRFVFHGEGSNMTKLKRKRHSM